MYSKRQVNLKYGGLVLIWFVVFIATIIIGDYLFKTILTENPRGQVMIYAVMLLALLIFIFSIGLWYIRHERAS